MLKLSLLVPETKLVRQELIARILKLAPDRQPILLETIISLDASTEPFDSECVPRHQGRKISDGEKEALHFTLL